jgi:hypothetical protein
MVWVIAGIALLGWVGFCYLLALLLMGGACDVDLGDEE